MTTSLRRASRPPIPANLAEHIILVPAGGAAPARHAKPDVLGMPWRMRARRERVIRYNYHTEAMENAFADIGSLVATGRHAW